MEARALDPITLEVVRNRLDAIAQEMQDALVRSGYSNIIKEGHDCSAALFDCNGEVAAQATALPAQLGCLPSAVRRVLQQFKPESMSDGDVFILNDPYDGGTHLPDIALIAPVFHEASVVAFTACIAHHQDIGGKTPGSLPTDSTEIFQEGLRIPLVKLYDKGTPNAVVHAFIERNVRIPNIVLGDLGAQLAALNVGKARLITLFEQHGTAQLIAYMSELLNRAEILTRRAIEQIRPGSYSFEDYLDSDGIDADRLVRIRVTVTVRSSDLHIDFNGSDAQVRGPINADKAAVMSAVYFVAKAIGDPTAPNNGGCYRPITVNLPEGSIVNPRPPAAVNGRTITMKRIADTILGALVPAMPQKIPAAPSGLVRVLVFGGNDPASGRTFVCTDFSTGGTGGHPQGDGVDSLETDIANTMNMPAESLELHYPLRVHRYVLIRDSGGAGTHRGGLGVEREIELLRGEATVTLREDRHRTKAWGLYGGEPPPFAHAEIRHLDGSKTVIPSKGVFRLLAGERIHCWATGGAGYGDALDRDPGVVVQDVVDDKVSMESAADRYGVVGIDRGRRIYDEAGTKARRQAMRARRSPISWTYDRGTRE